VRDALKNYLALASGLTEVGRQRAVAASKALVAQGEATADQVQSLAQDLVETSRNNREMVVTLVRTEIEKALSRLGVVTADTVQELTQRLQSVEAALRNATAADEPAAPAAPAAKKAPAKKAAAKPAAKPAAAAKAPAKKAAAKKPARKASS
jgi:polyhydroxyalkanoate synthesis regulator phasin